MEKQGKRSDVSLKQCWIEGGGVDLILLLVSSAMMDSGTLAMITSFVILSHVTTALYLTLNCKWRDWTLTSLFIRFGGCVLFLIALVSRSVISLF